jgi:ribosomal protein S27E
MDERSKDRKEETEMSKNGKFYLDLYCGSCSHGFRQPFPDGTVVAEQEVTCSSCGWTDVPDRPGGKIQVSRTYHLYHRDKRSPGVLVRVLCTNCNNSWNQVFPRNSVLAETTLECLTCRVSSKVDVAGGTIFTMCGDGVGLVEKRPQTF